MKKSVVKLLFCLSAVILLCGIASCSDKKSTQDSKKEQKETTKSEKTNSEKEDVFRGIKVTTTSITGPFGDYFEVVDKEYKIRDKYINVEVKRIAEGGPKPLFSELDQDRPSFILNEMDADGDVYDDCSIGDHYGEQDDINAVFSLKVGETTYIKFFIGQPSEMKMFKMSSTWNGKQGKGSATESSNNESASFSASSVILPPQLKGKVSVISASKSVDGYGFPEVSVTFKLLSKVNTKPMCSSYGQMWIVGVGQNENGVDVKELLPNYREWRSGDSDGSEFKAFLEGSPGGTITLDFTGSDENGNVSAHLAKVSKFKLKITN